jgi:V8-like Glu-specific endopeptidase
MRKAVFVSGFITLFLLLSDFASAQLYWKQYHIPTNTTTNINYTITSTIASDYKQGSKGALPENFSADTGRGFYPLDLVNDPNAYPWRMTVKFNGVSGVLIDPYHVLTAGHCVAQNQSFGSVKIYPGYALQDSPYGFALPEYVYLLSNYQISSATDIAIIKLDRPLGSLTGWCGYGYNNSSSFFTGNKFFNPSYPSAGLYNGELMYGSKGAADYVTSDYLYSFRTGVSGMSGSPEFTFLNGTPVSFGVLVSSGVKFNRINAGKFDALTKILTNNTPLDFDLVPLFTEVNPEVIHSGSGIDSVSFYVLDYSEASYTGNSANANIYLSQDSVITAGDVLLKTTPVNKDIPAKGTVRISTGGINTAGINPGNYWIGIILTGDNNSANNTTSYRDTRRIRIDTGSFVRISGLVNSTQSFSGISGVRLQGFPGNIVTDFSGNYTAFVPVNFSSVITPEKEGFSFSPQAFTLNNVNSDFTQNLTVSKKSYQVSINIKSPYAQNNVPGVKAYGLTGEPLSNTNGIVQVNLYHGWSGAVSLVKDGWNINPNTVNYTNISAVQNSNVSAGFQISGYVYDNNNTALQNASINGFPGSVTTNQYGYYSTILDSGWNGTTSAMLNNKVFNPAQRNYSGLSVRFEYQDFHEIIPVYANLKVFLSGAYVRGTDSMQTLLAQRTLLPSSPPETLSSKTVPFILKNREQYIIQTGISNIIDWVVIELLDKTTLAPVDTVAALLRNDGKIVSTNGFSLIGFDSRVTQGYYKVIIRHRNHIAVMSADSIQISTNPQLYDLSESPGKVYGSELKLLKTGLYGLFAGDSNYDGTIDSTDFGLFSIAGSGAVYGYAVSDYNLDGYVTAFDFNLFAPNRKAGITTHIITNLILKK